MDLPDWVPSAPLSHATYHLVTLISSHLSAYSVTSSLNFPPNFQLHLIHLSLFLSLITDIQTCSFGELFPLSSVIVNDPASFLEVIAKTPLLLMHDFPALAFWKTSPRIFFFFRYLSSGNWWHLSKLSPFHSRMCCWMSLSQQAQFAVMEKGSLCFEGFKKTRHSCLPCRRAWG